VRALGVGNGRQPGFPNGATLRAPKAPVYGSFVTCAPHILGAARAGAPTKTPARAFNAPSGSSTEACPAMKADPNAPAPIHAPHRHACYAGCAGLVVHGEEHR
jgi:hypothetical protein